MKRFMLAVMVAGLFAAPVRAAGTYEATVGANLVDLDSKRNRQQAMEYDGKLYYGAHGNVFVSNQGELGLFDISLKDIGSREEDLSLNLDYKSTFKMSASWSALHHRANNASRHGQIVNGVWRPNNVALTTGAERFTYRTGAVIDFSGDPNKYDYKMKRAVTEVNLGVFSPENSARWLTAQYWRADKTGVRFVQTATNILGEANVDNTHTDITLGFGTNIRENAALAVDLIRSEFVDNAVELRAAASNVATYYTPLLPVWPKHQMTAVESKWRYDVNKKLSLTGALTGRQRENMVNLYKFNSGVAAFNAAYRATNKLSLTAKTYVRYFEIDENQGFRALNLSATQIANPWLQQGNAHEFDKLQARGEFLASYRPVEKVHTKAIYKVELNHRRGAPTEEFNTDTQYVDGLLVPQGTRSNNVSNQDIKHILKLAAAVHLPLDVELEGEYTKLYANRPAFINMPTRKDEFGANLNVPLPAHIELSLGGTYSKERNANEATNHHMSRNAYRAGLDWEKDLKMFFGIDGSYEVIKYNSENYYQASNNPAPPAAVANINLPHESGALNRQKNTTLGAHGRVVCPKGFVVLGNGSYTWSVVQNPVNFGWANAIGLYGTTDQLTPAGTYINDIMPSEVRVARGTLGMEYTPEKFPSLTARASYTVTDWVDKVDSYNSGRASVAQLGASMKF